MYKMTLHNTLIIPKHIAIIMDGNGRWSKSKNLPKLAGHKKGADVAKETVLSCKKLGVKYVTLYAFSSENWNRPAGEVKHLMDLLRSYLKKDIKELIDNDVAVQFIGDRNKLDGDILELMRHVEKTSKLNQFKLVIALSYGSRDEIRSAALQFAKDMLAGKFSAENLKPQAFDGYLYTKDIPDPDLLIRTSGEHRLSNFLLWQLAYAELYFTSTYWPDFNEQELVKAIESFSNRNRRFGA